MSKRLPKRITDRWLARRNACAPARAEFRREYPDGLDLTTANLRKVRRRIKARKLQELDLHWLEHTLGLQCVDDQGIATETALRAREKEAKAKAKERKAKR